MCHHCLAEDPLPRRRFLQMAAAGVAAVTTGALLETSSAHADALPARKRISAPEIISRADWGADESLRNPSQMVGWAPPRKFVVHHTASPNSARDPRAMVRVGYRLHAVNRGFSDIGYHFLIGPKGEIYEGRRARKYRKGELHSSEDGAGNMIIGGHARGRNAGTIGIALLGTFTKRAPTNAAITSLIDLIAWESQRHKIDPLGNDTYIDLDGKTVDFPNIAAHRNVGATLCPGARMAASMPWLRREIADRVGRFPARTADMRKLSWLF